MRTLVEVGDGVTGIEMRRTVYDTWQVTTLPKVERLFETTRKAEAEAVYRFLNNRLQRKLLQGRQDDEPTTQYGDMSAGPRTGARF